MATGGWQRQQLLQRVVVTLIRQQVQQRSWKHKYPKQVRDRIDFGKVPRVDFAKEVEENLMRGGGPGGQSVATTSNAVQLIHIPTKVAVKCHETRSAGRSNQAFFLDKSSQT